MQVENKRHPVGTMARRALCMWALVLIVKVVPRGDRKTVAAVGDLVRAMEAED